MSPQKKDDESKSSKTTKKVTTKKPSAEKKTTVAKKTTAAKKTTPVKKTTATKKTTAVKKTTAAKKTTTSKKTTETKKSASEGKIQSKSKSKKLVVESPDDFDWSKFEEGIELIEEKKIKEFEKLIDENFVDTYDENVIQGVVINITEREEIIDINAKSEGVISLNEFRYNPTLKVGDKVEVIVDIQEDKTGQLVLSHRKARTIKAWERVCLLYTSPSPRD